MLILTIRTEQPQAEIGLFQDSQQLTLLTWHAHRQLAETIHLKIKELLTVHKYSWGDLRGVVIFIGPGSFTGLRISISVANALAVSLQLPIIGVTDNDWPNQGINRLLSGENDRLATPEYGSPPHITSSKK